MYFRFIITEIDIYIRYNKRHAIHNVVKTHSNNLLPCLQGYFRRAEVEAASELYDEAIISYTRALQLDPQNVKLMESIKNISDMQKKKIKGKFL